MQSVTISPHIGSPPLLMASEAAARSVGSSPPCPSAPQRIRIHLFCLVAALIFFAPWLCILGVTSFFRLSSPTETLQASVMDAVPGEWDKRIAINVGGFTLSLVRLGSHFFDLPPEAKAALEAVRGADVGIYKLERPSANHDYSSALALADRAMRRHGWQCIVGVTHPGQLVAIYMPKEARALKKFTCCVVVLNDQDLVVASGRGNIQPLLDLARQNLPEHGLGKFAFAHPLAERRFP